LVPMSVLWAVVADVLRTIEVKMMTIGAVLTMKEV
jgi:hypothetical protein